MQSKLISLTLCLLLIISLFNFSIVATESTDVTTRHSIETYADGNLLSGLLPVSTSNIAGGSFNYLSELTNGRPVDGYANNDIYLASDDSAVLVYKLRQPADISGFGFWGANSDRLVSYDIYVSDNADVFTDNTPVYSTESSGKKQVCSLIDASSDNVVYVGFLITSPSTVSGDLIARIDELAVFGTYVHEFVSSQRTAGQMLEISNSNILGGMLPIDVQPGSLNVKDFSFLTDWSSDDGAVIPNSVSQLRITYMTDEPCRINRAGLLFDSNPSAANYVIYISDNQHNLYSDENIVCRYENGEEQTGQFFELADNYTALCSFVGIEINYLSSDRTVSGLSEIFAGYQAGYIESTITPETIEANAGANLIGGKAPSACLRDLGMVFNSEGYYQNVTTVGFHNGALSDTNAALLLTDGNASGVTSHVDIYYYDSSTNKCVSSNTELIYQLDSQYKINGFELFSDNTANTFFEPSYSVYVGNDSDSLFDYLPIYSHTAVSDNSQKGQRVDFSALSAASGSYIGIKFTDSCSDHCGGANDGNHSVLRISEIAVYGEVVSSIGNTTFFADNTAVSVENNLLSGMLPINCTLSGSSNWQSGLTNGSVTDNNDIYGAYGKTLTYELNRETIITDFIFSHSNTNLTVAYELYFSKNQEDLFDNNNKVFAWSRTAAPRSVQQTVHFSVDNASSVRYVGIKFTDLTYMDIARIGEISLYGCTAVEGDINNDLDVDIRDIVRFKKYFAGITDDINIFAKDVDKDGKCNSADMARLRKYLLGAAEQLAVDYSGRRNITVELDNVVNDNFNGLGANIIPFSMMPSNTSLGYSKAYLAVETKRIAQMRLKTARIWAQVDWIEPQKGVYDYSGDEFGALCAYIDACKQAGTNVELTYNWKVGNLIQDWFSIEGVNDPYISAPADLDDYAQSCSQLLRHLWEMGYDNVKYISFANEPNGFWDWECAEGVDQYEYFKQMVIKVDAQFKADGIRDKVEIWCCEEADPTIWTEKLLKEIPYAFDSVSFHTYDEYCNTIDDWITSLKRLGANDIYMTEFNTDNNGDNIILYQRGFSGMIINGSQAGLTGLMDWCLSGVKSMSAVSASSWEMNGESFLWNTMLSGGMPNKCYYENSLISTYIDAGSKVVKTSSGKADDVRSSTFISPDGSVTILAECDASDKDRELVIDIDGISDNITFERHVYTDAAVPEFNAVIPRVNGVYSCSGGVISDLDIPNEHCLIVYTTKPAVTQIVIDTPSVALSKDKSTYKFTAGVIDGSSDIVWSVAEGSGTITAQGVYFQSKNSGIGDTIAIKAASTSDPSVYDIALIRIGE